MATNTLTQPFELPFLAGIKRDGTRFDTDRYVDGQWVRDQRGRPQKIGGYRQLTAGLSNRPHLLSFHPRAGLGYLHTFHRAGLERTQLDMASAGLSAPLDRSPAGFAANDENQWTSDILFDAASTKMSLVAHGAPNLKIDNDVLRPIYVGDIYGTTALTAIPSSDVSGGCLGLHPYLIGYSSDGLIKWTDSQGNLSFTDTANGAGAGRIASAKIVAAKAVRAGGSQSPAALLWTLNSVIRMTL